MAEPTLLEPHVAASSAARPPAVRVARLDKSFRLPHRRYSTLKERALHPLRSTTYDELRVLRDVSFEVSQGEFFGIVGRNGSGKSTLLKCLAGIYGVDRGEVEIRGRLSPFIELGVGFNPDLSARDNVVINAIMLGLSRREARARFDDIIAFAELEEFVDLKLKNYSSGMHVRLAFAVAIQVDAEIILVDEVLAVGDAAFQQKCFDQFQAMKDAGRTILFVTHDMGAVERFCDRAMLIERGEVVMLDEPGEVARQYNRLNFGHLPAEATAGGTGVIRAAWFEDVDGERVTSLAQGEPCRVCVEMAFEESVRDPVVIVTLRNEAHHTILSTSTLHDDHQLGTFPPGRSAVVTFEFENRLGPSRYDLTATVAQPGSPGDVIDLAEDIAGLVVHSTHYSGGVVDLPHRFGVRLP